MFIKDLVAQRELLIHLASKNLKVQYRKPWLGFLWAFIVPLCMAIIFKLVFSVLLRVSVEPYPFFLYVLTAIFPWGFTQMALLSATTSIVDNKHIIREARFLRELIPFSVILSHVVTFLPSLLIVVGMLIWFKFFTLWIILLPCVLFLHIVLVAGISLMTSVFHVRSRDTRFGLEVFLNALFYLTPVFYPIDLVARYLDGVFFRIYMLNPFVGLISLYRICFLKGFVGTIPEGSVMSFVVVPVIITGVFLAAGIVVFRSQQKNIVDYLEV